MQFIRNPGVSGRLGDHLTISLSKNWTHFRAAIAFAKRSGTRHIFQALNEFAQRGAVEIIVGIDHCGTSVEGLSELLNAVEPNGQIIVFRNNGPYTFHPKVYLFKSSGAAEVYLGSGNLTEGGLFTNYEAMIRLELDLGDSGQRVFLQSVEDVLDGWADLASGTARVLDDDLLERLKSAGLVVPEGTSPGPGAGTAQSGSAAGGEAAGDTKDGDGGALFPALPVPRAPIASRSSGSKTSIREDEMPSNGPNDPPGSSGGQLHFVMTLQRTDVGVGQVSPGTARRSPEIFIPLAARDAHPQFWGWPGQFGTVVTARKKKQHPVRNGVRMRFRARQVNVTMMVSTDKHDLRLRNGALRDAGNIGDILHLYEAPPNLGVSYIVEVIQQQDRNYPTYLSRCTNSVRNSRKRWGYY